jgi:hypothetical protein
MQSKLIPNYAKIFLWHNYKKAKNSKPYLPGEKFYLVRVSQKCRALVRRVGEVVVFISLHPDHGSAY